MINKYDKIKSDNKTMGRKSEDIQSFKKIKKEDVKNNFTTINYFSSSIFNDNNKNIISGKNKISDNIKQEIENNNSNINNLGTESYNNEKINNEINTNKEIINKEENNIDNNKTVENSKIKFIEMNAFIDAYDKDINNSIKEFDTGINILYDYKDKLLILEL